MNLKSLKVEECPLKQNSVKLSFELRSVSDFSNVMWETIPCRRSCVGKTLAEFDMCPWSLLFAGTGRAQTSTPYQAGYENFTSVLVMSLEVHQWCSQVKLGSIKNSKRSRSDCVKALIFIQSLKHTDCVAFIVLHIMRASCVQ